MMGYEQATIQISTRLSKHNSPRDYEHEALFDDLLQQIRLVVEQPKYEAISAWII
jgi:hypothetical protein